MSLEAGKREMIIRNENDLYIYFETIEQLEPQSILDIGMLLKRAGSVSRKAMNRKLSEQVRLDGVDFFPEADFLVWKQVYDTIMDAEYFRKASIAQRYDLAILLGMEALEQKPHFDRVTERIGEYSRYLLTERVLDSWKEGRTDVRTIDLHVENDSYYLLDFGV